MANAIFYDRKHDCEVSSSEIMKISAAQELSSAEGGVYDLQIGELGYKSNSCRMAQNWDRAVMYTDLVFLRFDFTNGE